MVVSLGIVTVRLAENGWQRHLLRTPHFQLGQGDVEAVVQPDLV